MTRTGSRQRKTRGNGLTSGDRESGRIWEGGEREEGGGPEPPSDGNNRTLNIKGQSLGISQAAVRGMEQHHPIIDKLGDPSDQTYRQNPICRTPPIIINMPH